MAETYGHYQTDRLFGIDPENYAALRLFGARYVISSVDSSAYPRLKDNAHYRLLGSMARFYFYKVYEYLDAQPPYSWEGGPADELKRGVWEPEKRTFEVHSVTGGTLALHEQIFPGWSALIDGKSATIQRWMGAFQAVAVPAGDHAVEFQYRSRLLGLGGGISLLALLGLVFWIRVAAKAPSAL